MKKYKVRIIVELDLDDPDQLGPLREYFKDNLCEFICHGYITNKSDYIIDCILTQEQLDRLPGKDSPYIEIIKEEYKKPKNDWDCYFNFKMKEIENE